MTNNDSSSAGTILPWLRFIIVIAQVSLSVSQLSVSQSAEWTRAPHRLGLTREAAVGLVTVVGLADLTLQRVQPVANYDLVLN
jgi:hypothetical protein